MGSTDETAAVLENCQRSAPHVLKLFTLSNGGPARARNCGVEAAKNERLLFVDDDVFPWPDMLRSHYRLLDAGYTGSQGLLVWHQEITITPLIRYIDSRGSQFAFDAIKDDNELDFAHVYTGNFAVLRSAVLQAGGFDEKIFNKEFALAAFEDTILGYNLIKSGAKIALNREAIADHLHDMSEESYFQREYKVGYCIGSLSKRYPDVAETLGWNQKDFLVESQTSLLKMLNAASIMKRLLGYPMSMRLRNREAFYRGFLKYKQEAAGKRGLNTQ